MTCTNGTCEYARRLKRATDQRTADQIRYVQLWTEIELPKLLKREEVKT